MTPSRAFLTSGVSVLTFMPGMAGMAHEATGFGAFSTCCRQQGDSVGLQVPQGHPAELTLYRLRDSGPYLNKAHAAVPRNGQALVIAEPARMCA